MSLSSPFVERTEDEIAGGFIRQEQSIIATAHKVNATVYNEIYLASQMLLNGNLTWEQLAAVMAESGYRASQAETQLDEKRAQAEYWRENNKLSWADRQAVLAWMILLMYSEDIDDELDA